MTITLFIISIISLIYTNRIISDKLKEQKETNEKIDITCESLLLLFSILTAINTFI